MRMVEEENRDKESLLSVQKNVSISSVNQLSKQLILEHKAKTDIVYAARQNGNFSPASRDKQKDIHKNRATLEGLEAQLAKLSKHRSKLGVRDKPNVKYCFAA